MKKIRALEPQLLVLEALTYNQWVITMGQMLQATSMDLYIHCVNVASIAAHMALFGNRQMLNEQGISPISLVLGAFLHDIGYIGKGCCSACGKNPQSMSYMEQLAFDEHISAGLEQVKHHTDDPVVLDIVSMHHEYLNGTGYPNGCRAEDIHLMSGSSPLPIPYALIWKIHSIRLLILRLCLWLSYWIICIMKQSVENTILHF